MDPAVFYMGALAASILTIFSFVKPLYGLLGGVLWLVLAVSAPYVSVPVVVSGEIQWVTNPTNWAASYLFLAVGFSMLVVSLLRTIKEAVFYWREKKEGEMP